MCVLQVFMNFSSLQHDGVNEDDSATSDTASDLTSARTSMIRGYENKTYIHTPQRTPTTPLHENGGRRVVSSLRSIPGYRVSNVAAAEDVNVSMVDDDTLKKRAIYGTNSFGAAGSDISAAGASSSSGSGSTASTLRKAGLSSSDDDERYVSEPRATSGGAGDVSMEPDGAVASTSRSSPRSSSSGGGGGVGGPQENGAYIIEL